MQEPRSGGAAVERMSVLEFQQAIRNGRFIPGDAVLYAYGRPTPLSWAIARVQRRALADLLGGGGEPDGSDRSDRSDLSDAAARIADSARYTHAGMVVDAEISAEMTAPRARLVTWGRRLRAGDRLLIVRPGQTGNCQFAKVDRALVSPVARVRDLQAAAAAMIDLAAQGRRYPWRELLTYWFSALPGALAAPHFAAYFVSNERDVCSGAIWTSWMDAQCVRPAGGDLLPEAWYPGRMALDETYLHRVAEVEVVPTAGCLRRGISQLSARRC